MHAASGSGRLQPGEVNLLGVGRPLASADEPDRIILACLEDHSSRPHKSPNKCPPKRPRGCVSVTSTPAGPATANGRARYQ